jgi:hypothetical protein
MFRIVHHVQGLPTGNSSQPTAFVSDGPASKIMLSSFLSSVHKNAASFDTVRICRVEHSSVQGTILYILTTCSTSALWELNPLDSVLLLEVVAINSTLLCWEQCLLYSIPFYQDKHTMNVIPQCWDEYAKHSTRHLYIGTLPTVLG